MTWSRNSSALLGGFLVLPLLLGGCELRQQMYDNGHIKPLEGSTFFADGRSSRPLVEGTVARGHLEEDDAFFRGKSGGKAVDAFPVTVDKALVERGRQRFDIYCSVCHGHSGYGDGMVAQRGFKKPPSFHEARLKNQSVGYFFDVITNGFGVMPSYKPMIKPQDRWAIVAYVRALQRSQSARIEDVPAANRAELE